MSTETVELWICESCGFIYDPAEGDPDGGIPPGTAFADIPGDWYCPVCGARKSDFVPYEAQTLASLLVRTAALRRGPGEGVRRRDGPPVRRDSRRSAPPPRSPPP